ncbi:MAG: hypothetical protein HC812_04480 [Leptolyngbya sp. RL_3_1]|nr:hypothetical protein [Leptolyngbya sp. RL_3_1]
MTRLRSALSIPGRRFTQITLGALGLVATFTFAASAEIIKLGFDFFEDLPTLSEGEQATLDILQTARIPLILSSVSPNGDYLVIATLDRLSQSDWRVQLFNLRTGELEESLALEYEVFSPTLPIEWLDNNTIRFVQESFFGPWEIVSINRVTGIVSHTVVYPTEEEAGEILGGSPRLFGLCPAGL